MGLIFCKDTVELAGFAEIALKTATQSGGVVTSAWAQATQIRAFVIRINDERRENWKGEGLPTPTHLYWNSLLGTGCLSGRRPKPTSLLWPHCPKSYGSLFPLLEWSGGRPHWGSALRVGKTQAGQSVATNNTRGLEPGLKSHRACLRKKRIQN